MNEQTFFQLEWNFFVRDLLTFLCCMVDQSLPPTNVGLRAAWLSRRSFEDLNPPQSSFLSLRFSENLAQDDRVEDLLTFLLRRIEHVHELKSPKFVLSYFLTGFQISLMSKVIKDFHLLKALLIQKNMFTIIQKL